MNEAYKPDNMVMLFGRAYIFMFENENGQPIIIGAIFWFVISILLAYLGWFIIKTVVNKYK